MTALLTPLALLSLTAGTGYVLLKLLLALWGKKLSQRWRCHCALALALLFLLPLYRLWALLPAPAAKPMAATVLVLSSVPSLPAFPWTQAAAGAAVVWLAVAALLLLWDILCLLRFRRLLRNAVPLREGPLTALAREEARRLGVRQAVRLLLLPQLDSPMMVGFFHPVLLLPTQDLAPADARLVLAHELVHYRRRDLWKKLLMEAVCVLHWFNPAAHLLKRDFLYWMETACDEAVVSSLDFAQRKRYGYLLIDGTNPTRPPEQAPSVPFAPSRETLERRITTMLHSEHKAHSALSGVLAMAMAAGCLVTTAFAADLDKGGETEPVKSSVCTVASTCTTAASTGEDVKLEVESGALTPGEEVCYTITTSDGSTEALSLEDMEDLGNGNYRLITNVDGEDVVLTLHVDAGE